MVINKEIIEYIDISANRSVDIAINKSREKDNESREKDKRDWEVRLSSIRKENRLDWELQLSTIRKESKQNIDLINKNNRVEMERYIGSLLEGHRHDMKLLVELTATKPDRDEVRNIVREEIKPLENKMMLIVEEMRAHNKEINRLRLKDDNHEVRISALEGQCC